MGPALLHFKHVQLDIVWHPASRLSRQLCQFSGSFNLFYGQNLYPGKFLRLENLRELPRTTAIVRLRFRNKLHVHKWLIYLCKVVHHWLWIPLDWGIWCRILNGRVCELNDAWPLVFTWQSSKLPHIDWDSIPVPKAASFCKALQFFFTEMYSGAWPYSTSITVSYGHKFTTIKGRTTQTQFSKESNQLFCCGKYSISIK